MNSKKKNCKQKSLKVHFYKAQAFSFQQWHAIWFRFLFYEDVFKKAILSILFAANHPLPSNDRYKVTENGTLSIRNVNREADQDVFACLAVNSKGERSRKDLHVFVLRKSDSCSL